MTDHKNIQSPDFNNKCLTSLLKKCKIFIENERYVYKACRDMSSKKDEESVKWLVVMEKTKDIRTNETRSNVADTNHAKFRANKLKVIKIFNKNNPKLTKRSVINKYNETTLEYAIGQIVESDDYDGDIDKVCSRGIHYFKTLETAYYYGDIQKNYSGYWTYWHDNGRKSCEGGYVVGEKFGRWICWHDNGQKNYEGEYVDGKESGQWTFWHDNGQKKCEGTYVDGRESGRWTFWHDNGQKSREGDYVNGQKFGCWTHLHDNGKKYKEGEYVDGYMSGRWICWHYNGQKSYEGVYVGGKESGQWTSWHNNGQKFYEGEYVNRLRVGHWIFWQDNGEIAIEIDY